MGQETCGIGRVRVKFTVKNAVSFRRRLAHRRIYHEFDFDSHERSCSERGGGDINARPYSSLGIHLPSALNAV